MGIEDSINLYHYLFNNPFRYVDPDGQFVIAIPIFITLFEFALPTFTVALPTLTQIGLAVGIAIVAAGYEVTKKANEWDERRNGYAMPTQILKITNPHQRIYLMKKRNILEIIPLSPFSMIQEVNTVSNLSDKCKSR